MECWLQTYVMGTYRYILVLTIMTCRGDALATGPYLLLPRNLLADRSLEVAYKGHYQMDEIHMLTVWVAHTEQ